jgi:hypothetical protein
VGRHGRVAKEGEFSGTRVADFILYQKRQNQGGRAELYAKAPN